MQETHQTGRVPALRRVGPGSAGRVVSQSPLLPAERASRSGHAWFVAAPLIVLAVGLGGALAGAGQHEGGSETISGQVETAVEPEPLSAPEQVWGHTWDIERVTAGTRVIDPPDEVGVNPPAGIEYGKPHVLFPTVGRLGFVGCNAQGGEARIEGDRLVVESEWTSTFLGCPGVLAELDERLYELLRSRPTIELRGDRLTLRSAGSVAMLTRRSPDQGVRRPGVDRNDADGPEGALR